MSCRHAHAEFDTTKKKGWSAASAASRVGIAQRFAHR
jgi:hypothetical protein